MKRRFSAWGEHLFYAPTPLQRFISYLLWPFGVLYCFAMRIRFMKTHPADPMIAVVSVGNLTVGGSGKTPLVTALAKQQRFPGIVLRGYGRKSSGLQMVSDGKSILCDVQTSGDEAMIYALKVPQAVVIVSEDREAGIAAAKEAGCDCVFLDDGYGKHHIKKYEIVIAVDTPNRFCLPAGPYRERLWPGKTVKLVKEGREFERQVSVIDAAESMALVTAIARPERLDRYLPPVVSKHYFADHHFFSKAELEAVLTQSGAEKLLVTYKDYVKIRSFNLPLALLELELRLDPALSNAVENYIRTYDEN